MKRVDLIIVGGGIAGLATAWSLARRGMRDVLVLERECLLCAHSSGRNAAILRTVGPDPLISRLCARSAARLRQPPEGFSGVPLVEPCGLILVAGSREADELRRWIRSAGEAGAVEELTQEQLRRMAPHFIAKIGCAFHFPLEGRLEIEALGQGFARGARTQGVEIRTGAGVRRVLREGGRVIGVRLEDGQEICAETTVIAAGGWSGELGTELGSRVRLQPTRRHLMVTAPDRRVDPAWPVVWCLGEDFYCRPESGGLLLCACDQDVVDPNTCHPTGEMCQVVAEKAARLLPSHADAGAAHFWCGIRTLTEDGRFVIGFDPELRNLFWVAGLGGHGMVCSFEVGRLAADLLSGCDKDREVARALSPARFAAAGMIRSRSATGRA